jgi:hypothetical protein
MALRSDGGDSGKPRTTRPIARAMRFRTMRIEEPAAADLIWTRKYAGSEPCGINEPLGLI